MSLAEALEKRFAPPAWALFHEVANGTGWNWSRHADAIAMGIWPSRGLEVHGMEFKSNRSDWLRELKDPQKAEDMVKYCDYWWLVTTKDDIAHADEIPSNWGHLTLRGTKLFSIKPAPKREAVQLDKGFVAAILRKAYAIANDSRRIQEKVDAAHKRGADSAQSRHDAQMERAQADRQELQAQVNAFEKASGIKINQWNGADTLGKAVRALLTMDKTKYVEDLQAMASTLTYLASTVGDAAKELKAYPPTTLSPQPSSI
jgi:hypothetical protein